MNMFLGLLFQQSAKSRRSITSWREEAKGVLPTTNLRTAATLDLNRSGSSSSGQSSNSSTMYEEKAAGGVTELGAVRNASRAGYGFGRQGEKAAGLKGFLIFKPLETLPCYAARPTSVPSRSSHSASPQPRFASSGSAI